jgi:hypothetical protein
MFWHLTMRGSQPSGTRWGPSQNCCLLSGTLWLLHQGWLRPWKRCLSPKEGDGPSADDLATTAERFVKYFLVTTAETSEAAAARYAPRADLDHARVLTRRLRDLGFLPIGPSALDLALAVSDWLAFQPNYDPKPRATRAGNPPFSPKLLG